MATTVEDATAYINVNCISIDDWTDADDAKKLRIVNVAGRTLTNKYAQYTIPDAAVYEYANELAIAFNDTNALQQQGVASFGLTGVANFTFKDWAKTGLDAWIPDIALELISAANGGVKLGRKTAKWVTM
ncbi:hypothetical protein BSK46_14240 [Paenibacillus odorifer]|uniref:hypothetical protein n=1 Tax=Paenibacillus odorifer TaxID=189426 RepID=UPI00096E0B93|nr:hypothetical protein [Paenibacillus odorifer]OME37886.1 hypothetical protein BSK46_14240 [Paenibacillus odorifer]